VGSNTFIENGISSGTAMRTEPDEFFLSCCINAQIAGKIFGSIFLCGKTPFPACLITSAKPLRSSRSGRVLQKNGIDEYRRRVLKNADGIFYFLKIDAEFAADGRIGHGKQGGRYLHKIDAAFPGGCAKTAHIADDAAAEVDNQGMAVELGLQHLFPDGRAGLDMFIRFSGGISTTGVFAGKARSARK
jgi:hypothetical protein